MAAIPQLPPSHLRFKNISSHYHRPNQVLGQNWFVTIKRIEPGSALTPEVWELEGVDQKPAQTLYEVNGIIQKLMLEKAIRDNGESLDKIAIIGDLSKLAMKVQYKKNLLGRYIDAFYACSATLPYVPVADKSRWPETAIAITKFMFRKKFSANSIGFLSFAARKEAWDVLKIVWNTKLPSCNKRYAHQSITVTPGDRRLAFVVRYLCKITSIMKLFAAVIIHPRIALTRIPEAALNPRGNFRKT